MKIENVISQIWEVYNEHNLNGVFIIGRAELKLELERIKAQNSS